MPVEPNDDDEENNPRLECPTCRFSFRKKDNGDKRAGKGSSFQMSHDARAVFTDDKCPCPVCHKDHNAQPMVHLPCGHYLCQDDFTKLGGEVTQLPEPSRGNPSRNSRANNDNNNTDGMDLFDVLRSAPSDFLVRSMMSPVQPSDFSQMFRAMNASATQSIDRLTVGTSWMQASEDNDEDDESDDDLPHLLTRDGAIAAQSDDDDDDVVPRNVD